MMTAGLTPYFVQDGVIAEMVLSRRLTSRNVTVSTTDREVRFQYDTFAMSLVRRVNPRLWTIRTDRIPPRAVDKRLAIATRFRELSDRWKAETRFLSSSEEIVLSDAYQRIIAMGPDVLPLIFAELRSEGDSPSYWHWALERLASADPTTHEMQGNSRMQRDAWLSWARDNGATL